MINETKRFPQRICLKGIRISDAIMTLKSFKPSQNLEKITQDVIEFLSSIDWDKTQKDIPHSFYHWPGNNLAEEILEKWDWDDEIAKKASDALNPIISEINLSAKYYFAWRIVQSILSVKPKVSYELIWESGEDLACSFLLAKEGFYKQAFQALRNYLEVCVSMLYFAVNNNAYREWIENKNFYYFPKFHEDMLEGLRKYLDCADIEFMSGQYTKLNSSVHSRRHRINMNIGRLQRSENDYGARDLRYWCKSFNTLVRFMAGLDLRTLFVSIP